MGDALAIPDYQSIMLPLLEHVSDGDDHDGKVVREQLADYFNLSESEREEMLPSGNQRTFDNRWGWARTYLKKAGLLEYVDRGVFRITDRGRKVLADKPDRISARYLRQFEEFVEFVTPNKNDADVSEGDTDSETDLSEGTLDEIIERSYQKLRNQLASDLLEKISESSWQFFERLVVDLLISMGYGGSRKEAGQAFQRGADEGIDGIIKEDRLGLDIIYIQAKRWQGTVGRPEIQKFAGALQGKRAKKGVFITTSTFSDGAVEFARSIESKIILIDGARLSELMIDHCVGVSNARVYEIRRLDLDYFSEE